MSTVRAAASASRWAFLAAAIALEVSATLSLKAAMDAPLLYLVVVLGYSGAFAALAMVLRAGMPLGVAYGIWGASGVALTALLSSALFGEPLSPLMAIGIVLVMAGMAVVEVGAQRATAAAPEQAPSGV